MWVNYSTYIPANLNPRPIRRLRPYPSFPATLPTLRAAVPQAPGSILPSAAPPLEIILCFLRNAPIFPKNSFTPRPRILRRGCLR